MKKTNPAGRVGDTKKPWSLRKKVVVGTVLALSAVLVALVVSYASVLANPASAFKPEDFAPPSPSAELIAAEPTLTPEPSPGAPEATPSPSPTQDPNARLAADADMSLLQNRLNVMLLGLDESRERANWGSFRTDTMILLSLNFETKDVDMISIPRDSYVKIYGKESRGKVNSAFSAGGGKNKKGFEYAMKTVSDIFGGVTVNYYIGFNMQMVKDVVDAMGGVEYEVDIEVRMNGRELHPGLQHMNGQAVLDYARQRKGSSDVARVDRQQRILMAIFKQMLATKQFANIPSIFTAVESNMATNLSFQQISALALFASGIGLENLDRHLLDGDFLDMRKTSYWGVSEYKKQQLIKEIFGIDYTVDPSGDVTEIKRELEEIRQQIMGELNMALALEEKCRALAADYAQSITAEEASMLELAASSCREAYDMEEKEDLDVANAYAAHVYNTVSARLGLQGGVTPSEPGASDLPGGDVLSPNGPDDTIPLPGDEQPGNTPGIQFPDMSQPQNPEYNATPPPTISFAPLF